MRAQACKNLVDSKQWTCTEHMMFDRYEFKQLCLQRQAGALGMTTCMINLTWGV